MFVTIPDVFIDACAEQKLDHTFGERDEGGKGDPYWLLTDDADLFSPPVDITLGDGLTVHGDLA